MNISKQAVLDCIYEACNGMAPSEIINAINTLPSISDGWISVETALPDYGEKVLICRYSDNILMGKLMRNSDESNVWMAFFKDAFAEADGVTHWQPLPPAPTK